MRSRVSVRRTVSGRSVSARSVISRISVALPCGRSGSVELQRVGVGVQEQRERRAQPGRRGRVERRGAARAVDLGQAPVRAGGREQLLRRRAVARARQRLVADDAQLAQLDDRLEHGDDPGAMTPLTPCIEPERSNTCLGRLTDNARAADYMNRECHATDGASTSRRESQHSRCWAAFALPASAHAWDSPLEPVTPAMDATQPHGLGLVPDGGAEPAAASRASAPRCPPAVDLTADAVPPGDQGQVNACAAWATDYSAMGY